MIKLAIVEQLMQSFYFHKHCPICGRVIYEETKTSYIHIVPEGQFECMK